MATYYLPNETGWQANGGGTYSTYLRVKLTTSYDRATNKTAVTAELQVKNAVFTLSWRSINTNYQTFTANGNTWTIDTGYTAQTHSDDAWYTLTKTGASALSYSITHGSDGSATISVNVNLMLYAIWYVGNVRHEAYSTFGNLSASLDISQPRYTLSISQGTGTSVTVKRGNETLTNGATIYKNDTLTFTYSVSTGYNISTHSVNGTSRSSGYSWTVTGPATVATTATVISYTLSISAGTGSSITVNRTSSPKKGAATGNLSNGAAIYYSDVLQISFAASSGYAIATHTVNGTTFTSGNTHTVTGAVSVVSTATATASAIASCSSSVATQGTLALVVTRYNSAYYHKATFKIGSTTLATSSAFATSLSYTVPRSWFNSYPNDTSKTVTVSVQTYTNSACTTTVGAAVTTTFTMTADSGMKPTIGSGFATAAAYNTGTAASGITGYVQGYSKARLTLTKSALTMANNATVASYKVTCQGATTTKSSPGATETVDTAVLTGTSAITITITVTDSRGRTASTTKSVTPMAYAKPVLTGISVFRCNISGVADESGTYYSAKATETHSSLGGQNSATLKAQIKAVTDPSYGALYNLTSGTARVLGNGLLNADVSYIVRLVATDSLSNTADATVTIPAAAWAMKFRPDGKGVGFGMVPQHSKALEIPADWEMYFGTETFKEHAHKQTALRGTAIPSGADLNDYTTPGEYYIQNGTIAATVGNNPYTTGNSRVSFLQGGSTSWGVQILTATGSDKVIEYKRRYDVTTDTWSAWVQVMITDDIGERVTTEPSAVNVANASDTEIATVTLTAGKWVVHAMGRFASNATGYRKIFLLRGTSTTPWIAENANSNAVSGDYTFLSISTNISITSSTTFTLMAFQNSGGSLSTTGRIYCTKII